MLQHLFSLCVADLLVHLCFCQGVINLKCCKGLKERVAVHNTKRQTNVHAHIHPYSQFRIISYPDILWRVLHTVTVRTINLRTEMSQPAGLGIELRPFGCWI